MIPARNSASRQDCAQPHSTAAPAWGHGVGAFFDNTILRTSPWPQWKLPHARCAQAYSWPPRPHCVSAPQLCSATSALIDSSKALLFHQSLRTVFPAHLLCFRTEYLLVIALSEHNFIIPFPILKTLPSPIWKRFLPVFRHCYSASKAVRAQRKAIFLHRWAITEQLITHHFPCQTLLLRSRSAKLLALAGYFHALLSGWSSSVFTPNHNTLSCNP